MNSEEEKLIAKQALEIERLKAMNQKCCQKLNTIRNKICANIGSPFNGNKYRYTQEQLKLFDDICKVMET